MKTHWIKLFLRFSIAAGFLSAVADRLGMWGKEISVWGNWENFVAYTGLINPLIPAGLLPATAVVATVAEVVFALCLIIGLKTELIAKLSGFLLLAFGLAMAFSTGIKGAFDYSVFAAAAAAFALSTFTQKYLEIDTLLFGKK